MSLIRQIRSREIFDSRGNPTIEVEVFLNDGAWGRALVPSGASTGRAEALELRDGDLKRFGGRGVLKAVANFQNEIAAALRGMEASEQRAVDDRLIALDGTGNKARLGANAILGASLAVARAAANSAGLEFYQYLGGASAAELPVPMVNILSGGIHGGGNVDFQDFMVIPLRARTYSESLRDAVSVYRAMKEVLKSRNLLQPGVADEGGFAPRLPSNQAGFELMVEAFERAGLQPGRDAAIAVDVAASHFAEGGRYALSAEGTELDSQQLVNKLAKWTGEFPILSIEDGVGDLFVTNLARLQRGIQAKVANAVLVKMNQIGTLSETLEVVELAQRQGYRVVVSARSGETEDDSLADLAVATPAAQIKIGSVTCSERLAKYNRLLRIEEQLGLRANYRGAGVFSGLKFL